MASRPTDDRPTATWRLCVRCMSIINFTAAADGWKRCKFYKLDTNATHFSTPGWLAREKSVKSGAAHRCRILAILQITPDGNV